jgi:hypothetical protein
MLEINLSQIFGGQIATLFGFITVDVLLGIAAAIRSKTFDWRKVSMFYQTMVIPYLIGWTALAIGAKVVVPEAAGPYAKMVSSSVVNVAWLYLLGELAASWIKNGKIIWTKRLPFSFDE